MDKTRFPPEPGIKTLRGDENAVEVILLDYYFQNTCNITYCLSAKVETTDL